MDEENLSGLELYFEMATAAGLIPRAKPLEFASPAAQSAAAAAPSTLSSWAVEHPRHRNAGENKPKYRLTITTIMSILLYAGRSNHPMINNAEFFHKHVSARLERALLKLLLENYKDASRFCFRNFAAPQAKDLSGVYRRAKIEENLSGLPDLFPGVKIEVKPYDHNTGFYSEITCGQIRLTQSCIVDPDDVPRLAKFRSTLAKNGQLLLFRPQGGDNNPGEIESQFMYAILTHGVDVNSPKRAWPAFVRIQFPNESYTQYLDDGINLLTRFPDLMAEYVPRPAIQPRPRRYRRREQGRA